MMNTKINSCILWVLSLILGTLPLLAELKYFPKDKEELLDPVKDENIKLDEIDTSRIKDMSFLFCQTQEYQCENSARTRTDFRGIEDWDVSNVKNMGGMFRGATSFNQPLNKWGSRLFQ